LFEYMNRVVYPVGRITPNGVSLLGTACMLAKPGRFATVAHVTAADDTNLVIVIKDLASINDFQDTSDTQVKMIPASIEAIDPVADLAVLKTESDACSNLTLGSIDGVSTGEQVHLFGYPHADQGRLVLTYQQTEVGARVLIANQNVKTKHLVLNIQSRPGQSGSPVVAGNPPRLAALLVGSYAPGGGGGISLAGVDPHTLHQTTHAVSAEYLGEMMKA
jgi:V8-like Glu-specific endopeptidase